MKPPHTPQLAAPVLCMGLLGCANSGVEAQGETQQSRAATTKQAMVQNELAEEQTEFVSEALLDLERIDTKLQRLAAAAERHPSRVNSGRHSVLEEQRSALGREVQAAHADGLAEWDQLELRLEGRIASLEAAIDDALEHAHSRHPRASPEHSAGGRDE